MPLQMARPAALTPKQVAEALNMSRRQVYRWIQKDEIETTKIDGTHRIFERQLAEKIGKQEAADVFSALSTDVTDETRNTPNGRAPRDGENE